MTHKHYLARTLRHTCFIILLFFAFPLLGMHHSRVYAAVVINELYPKPSDEQSEWIELYNSGTESVSLNQWKLENTEGDKKIFIINASGIIQPKGYLLFPKSQSGIPMRNDGDTIRLIDQNNSTVDTQSFLGILGYNTSAGRTVDGAGSWSTCTTSTPETKNVCPEPSPTPSPLTTDSPIPTLTPVPTVATVIIPIDSPTPIVEIVYVTKIPTPSPTSSEIVTFSVSKSVGVQIIIVGCAWILIAATALINKSRRKNQK